MECIYRHTNISTEFWGAKKSFSHSTNYTFTVYRNKSVDMILRAVCQVSPPAQGKVKV